VLGKSTANVAGDRSFDVSLITGNRSAANPFRLVGHAVGAGLKSVSMPIASPDHNPGLCPFAGRYAYRLPSLSPVSTSFEPTANAANGEAKLPLVTTAPLASVNVIEPTENGSGSHPGVEDAASPIPATVQTRGTTTSGATTAASITMRVACHPCNRRRIVCSHHCCAFCTATLTSHPRRRSARTVVNRQESRPTGETGTAENAHARRTQGERKEFGYVSHADRGRLQTSPDITAGGAHPGAALAAA
jgi:hypothetical protein